MKMNPLFGMLNGQAQMPTEAPSAAQTGNRPPMDFNAAMGQLKANPMGLLKQAGYDVPGNIGNDPQKMVMHLIRSGQVGGPMMRMIQPMLNRMGVK